MEEKILNEMNQLKFIINFVFDVDILTEKRKRKYVDARKVFSKILNDNGFGSSIIGKYLKKDHSSIIHYLKTVNSLIKFDQLLMDRYLYSKDMYLNKKEIPYYQSSHNKLTSREKKQQAKIYGLNEEIEKLIIEKSNLIALTSKNKRLSQIIELIDKQTPHGQESYVMRKINTMFNGLNFYG
jgi:hypothetical protein